MTATSFLANPRRSMQILLLTAIVIFVIALVHSFGSEAASRSAQWVSDKLPSLGGGASNGGSPPAGAPVQAAAFGRAGLVEHMRLAEAAWNRAVEKRHKTIRDNYGSIEKMQFFNTGHQYSSWDLYQAAYTCPHEMDRVGTLGDGGKWTCGMSRYEAMTTNFTIYSFGVQQESSYEQEMLARTKCEIWGYDYSVDKFGPQIEPQYLSRTHFSRVGIGGKTETDRKPPFWSIEDLMRKNGHDYIDVMKMDIEGSEFDALPPLIDAFIPHGKEFPVGQLMIEIHNFNSQIRPEQLFNWWEKLEAAGMRPIFMEPNLLSNYGPGSNTIAVEYTFINVKDSRSELFKGAHQAVSR